MTLKAVLAAAIFFTAIPAHAELAARDAATVFAAIEKDEGKRRIYCEAQQLLAQSEEAAAKQDEAGARALSDAAEAKSAALGATYQQAMAVQELDATSDEGKAFFAALESLERSCRKG